MIFFDGVHQILARHQHPFILVGARATRWMGSKAPIDPACDIVLRRDQLRHITSHLAAQKDWKIADMRHEDPNMGYNFFHDLIFLEADALLERTTWVDDGVSIRYLRIWSDESLHMNLSSRFKLVEVPDVHTRKALLVEDEYHPCKYGTDDVWLGPDTLSMAMESPPLPFYLRHGYPYCNHKIFIPSIPVYWSALVAQEAQSQRKGLRKSASRQMNLLFRYLLRDLWKAVEEDKRERGLTPTRSAEDDDGAREQDCAIIAEMLRYVMDGEDDLGNLELWDVHGLLRPETEC